MPTKHGWLTLVAFAALFTAAACSTSTIGAGPCDGPNPPEACSTECTGDQSCDLGYHCNAQDTCYAECTAGGGECGGGYYCDDRGRCQSDGGNNGTPDASCPSIQVNVDQVTPTVQILIDQSGTMNYDFGGVTRWNAVRYALTDPQDGVVARLQDEVIFGATLYTSTDGYAGGQCPQLQTAPYQLNNYQAIYDLMADNAPVEETPTAESIDAVVASFPEVDPQAPGPRIIVLATDGNPDNCVDPDAHDESSQTLSETAAQNAYSKGIQTYVLSVGDDVAIPHLQRMANAGRGQPLDTGTEPYYVANNPDQLVNAFDQILNGARTCVFSVDGTVTDPTTGTVELNGELLEYGTDWTMSNETTLELLGTACDTFLSEPNADLSAEFECGGVIVL